MTLGRRLTGTTAVFICGIVLLGAASTSGLSGLREHARIARDEFLELRMIQRAEAFAEDVHGRSRTADYDRSKARDELDSAISIIDEFLAFQDLQVGADPAHQEAERRGATRARASLVVLRDGAQRTADIAEDRKEIESALGELNQLIQSMDRLIAINHASAATKLYESILFISILAVSLAIGAVILGFFHHRSIMRPIRRMQAAVRRIASGALAERVAICGDAELVALSEDLNRMAQELQAVYRDLEEKVRVKSHELVRSERLASVGFLAAGVAHEINNPLNIMSGFAELSLSRLRKASSPDAVAEARESLQIIRDEAFRCRDILQRLLSLAKMGDDLRAPVSMSRIIDEIVHMIRAVSANRHRDVSAEIPQDDGLVINGNESEMKQVLLNLVINALNAVKPVVGRVKITGRREGPRVVVDVTDNGCGMSPQTIEQVFEPFFTLDTGAAVHGAGLGLSISHAIVEAHGGSVTAQSDGLGCGSRFTVSLPAEARSEASGQAA
ncbi:MAG: HAMP domain-containing histidine kinase [Phycisphaerae bacterium]|nr:HAMP domain-containing histidine kinase [Phycisphaerae bacterium]